MAKRCANIFRHSLCFSNTPAPAPRWQIAARLGLRSGKESGSRVKMCARSCARGVGPARGAGPWEYTNGHRLW